VRKKAPAIAEFRKALEIDPNLHGVQEWIEFVLRQAPVMPP
jgi:hypothetical protein